MSKRLFVRRKALDETRLLWSSGSSSQSCWANFTMNQKPSEKSQKRTEKVLDSYAFEFMVKLTCFARKLEESPDGRKVDRNELLFRKNWQFKIYNLKITALEVFEKAAILGA